MQKHSPQWPRLLWKTPISVGFSCNSLTSNILGVFERETCDMWELTFWELTFEIWNNLVKNFESYLRFCTQIQFFMEWFLLIVFENLALNTLAGKSHRRWMKTREFFKEKEANNVLNTLHVRTWTVVLHAFSTCFL